MMAFGHHTDFELTRHVRLDAVYPCSTKRIRVIRGSLPSCLIRGPKCEDKSWTTGPPLFLKFWNAGSTARGRWAWPYPVAAIRWRCCTGWRNGAAGRCTSSASIMVSIQIAPTGRGRSPITPAMSAPLGMSHDGLPIGSQFAAAKGREDLLYALAYELEAAQPWATRTPEVWMG